MSCPDKYDLQITSIPLQQTHGLVCDWSKGGAGLKVEASNELKSSKVSTKGDYGVRDANDFFRIVQTDWSEGGGQTTYDREADSENAFWSSRHIDNSKVGSFTIGPASSTSDQTNALPDICAALSTYLVCAWNAAPFLKYSHDNVTWTSCSGTMPASPPTSLCSDGKYVYAAANGVWRGSTTNWALFTAETGIDYVAFTAGILYGAKDDTSTTAKLGWFSGAGAYTDLSPLAGSAFNAAGTTFGLVASGNYVYWGVTNGVTTKLYKCMYGGGATKDTFEEVCAFPSGFVGASLYSYLGDVYVGGHFDGTATDLGIGAIYAVIADSPALLTEVGTDKTLDNRVLSMCAYERNLYFVSAGEVWRWDLRYGGYSHWAGPVQSTPLVSYLSIVWIGDWACNAIPGTGAEKNLQGGAATIHSPDDASVSDPSAAILNGAVKVTVNGRNAWLQYEAEHGTDAGGTLLISDGTGTTLEVLTPANLLTPWMYSLAYPTFRFGLNGSSKCIYLRVWYHSGSVWSCGLYSGNLRTNMDTLLGLCTISIAAHTLRLTLKGTSAKFYCDGVLKMSKTATAAASPAKTVWMRTSSPSTGDQDAIYSSLVNQMRWSDDGAYDKRESQTITGVGLACAQDAVWASCSGVGVMKSDPSAYYVPSEPDEAAELVSSQSAGSMPTVEKYFRAIHVQLDGVLPTGCTVAVDGTIDGNAFSGSDVTPLDALGDDTASLRIFNVDIIGKNIVYRVHITGTAELAPVVSEVAVLFKPMPKTPKTYTYFVRCWDAVESRLPGHEWDEDARTVADFLEDIANTVVTVERPGRPAFYGNVEGIEYLEAPPSDRSGGREGLYSLTIRSLGETDAVTPTGPVGSIEPGGPPLPHF